MIYICQWQFDLRLNLLSVFLYYVQAAIDAIGRSTIPARAVEIANAVDTALAPPALAVPIVVTDAVNEAINISRNAVRNAIGRTLIIKSNALETIGISPNHRMKELIFEGPEAIIVEPQVYAKTITLNGKGVVDFGTVANNRGLDQGVGGLIDVNQNVTVRGDITGTGTRINLHKNTLTLNQGTTTLNGDVIIDTEFKGGAGGIGHIVADGAAANLNLAGANSVTINLTGTSSPLDIGKSYSFLCYHLIFDLYN